MVTDSGNRVELTEHALECGQQNLPESTAVEPNDFETAIWREHERQHQAASERTRAELHTAAAEFEAILVRLPNRRDLAAIVHGAAHRVQRDLAVEESLPALWQALQARRRELRLFMHRHGLAREAQYPSSRLRHFSTLAVLVVLESGANASFFANGSDLGLMGGFLQAVTVSLVNAVGGVLAGFFCWRGLFHWQRRIRMLAVMGLATLTTLAVVFNLGVAAYRDAVSTGTAPSAMSHGLSFTSLVLFVLGLIAWALCLAKGATADDRVPGHGALHRRFKTDEAAFLQGRDQHRRGTLAHVESIPTEFQSLLRRTEAAVEQLRGVLVRMEHSIEVYGRSRTHLEGACRVLLQTYRSTNAAVRTTRPPLYFTAFPEFRSVVDSLPRDQFQVRIAVARDLLDVLRAEVHRLLQGQPERIADASARFATYLAAQLAQADAGRADGSHDHAHPAPEQGG